MMAYFRKIILTAVTVLFTVSCATNRNISNTEAVVTPLAGKTAIQEGSLIYGLPLTVLDVELVVERIIERPGPYSKYAADLLGLADAIKSENEYWNITGINIGTHQELDPEQFYVIEADGLFLSNALSLKRTGLILDINPDIYNLKGSNITDESVDYNKLRVFDLGSDEYFRDRKDTLYRVVNLDTAFVRIPYLVEKKQKLTLDQLAEKAAVRLMELRDGKHLILTGETNVFPQNDAALNELNRMEKEYTELFTGKTFREKLTFKYQLIPKKTMTGKQTALCLFSETNGPVSSAEKTGVPIMIEFFPEPSSGNLNVNYAGSSGKSQDTNRKLFYRVPEVVNVRLSIGNEILNSSRKLIYQFGEIIRFPQNYIIGK